MANVHDVAAYILQQHGEMSTWKLQKLVYYSQAWHLAWDEEPLFSEPIEAWANGPVVRELYVQHRGQFSVGSWTRGDPSGLKEHERATIDAVLADYGSLSGRQLSHLTHQEDPWRHARGSLPPTEASNVEITRESIQAYYGALDADPSAPSIGDIDWLN